MLLGATLVCAVVRPRDWPEAAFAVPAAAVLLLLGVLPLAQAGTEIASLAPTVGFLAAVLVLADLCDRHGLFEAAGSWMARRSGGKPVALLALVFFVASVVTAVLSLDATVVLLTPVVITTVRRLRLRAKPHAYACTHLANSASLLLPVSNLTNLLAFRASGLSFARFGAIMALPWLAAIAVEWLVLRRFFASDLVGRGETELRRATAGTRVCRRRRVAHPCRVLRRLGPARSPGLRRARPAPSPWGCPPWPVTGPKPVTSSWPWTSRSSPS